MIIFDEKEYAEECLRKKSLKTKKYENKEINCIVRYMQLHNFDREQIKNKILEIGYRDLAYYETYDIERIVNMIIDWNSNRKLKTNITVRIYQEELKAINEIEDEEARNILWVLTIYSKWLNLKWFEINSLDIIKLSKIKNNYGKLDNAFYILHKSSKLISKTINLKLEYSVPFIQKDGVVVLEIDKYTDLPYYLEWLNGNDKYERCECGRVYKRTKKRNVCLFCSRKNILSSYKIISCEKCGQNFEVGSKTKRVLCDECYKKYIPKETKIITCGKCGKSFEADANTKRVLCDECYKEYRRECKTEIMRKLREK